MEKTINAHSPKSDRPPIIPLNELDLYEIRVITDIKAGELRWYIPVDAKGHMDPVRPYKFRGYTPVATPVGQQNFEFALEASTLSDALIEWPRKLEKAILEFQEKFAAAQRRAMLATPPGGRPV